MSEALPAVIGHTAQDIIAANLARHAHMARGATAAETDRAMKKAGKGFLDWASANERQHVPADVETVVAYVDWLAEAGKRPSTIRQAVWAISQIHVQARVPDPTKDQDVKLALKRMSKKLGTAQNQAAPLGQDEVEAIVASAGGTAADLRNVALLLTMRDLLARRSEVVALEVADIEVNKGGIVTATIRRSKTDKYGEGASKWLDPETHAAILRWLTMAGIEAGPIFRSVNKSGKASETALSPGDVPRILKSMAQRAGLDHRRISGHSARVGAAQDLAASGTELPALMTAGRWKTATMPARYVEKLAEGRGAMATYKAKLKAKRQGVADANLAPAFNLAAAAAAYVRAEWSPDDGPVMPDDTARDAIFAVCSALYIDAHHAANPTGPTKAVLDVLGGADYVRACLEWQRAVGAWEISRERDKGPRPEAPPLP